MRGTRAVVVAIALIAVVPGSARAQERGGGTATPDKKVDKKKTVKKKTVTKGKKHKATGAVRTDKVGSAGALSKRPPEPGDEIEFTVKSSPRGAAIEIDGVSFGVAPVKVRSRTGRRVVSAKLAGYADAATTIQVDRGLGYVVFSLAREAQPAKVADKGSDPPSSGGATSGFGTKKISYSEAMQKARMSLKREDYAAALRYAQAALASKPDDGEAKMIATISSCGTGDGGAAKRYLPQGRGSYREISITRCGRLGISLP